ncbi:MAG: response regulator, partial [Alphaproteobacteria bacterium]|nr:response regulator [Alphaproteobacteria bacterium]
EVPHILHVEDDTDLSEMLTAALQDKARVMTTTTLAQARGVLGEVDFSLVIIDIGLPDGLGLVLIDEMRKQGIHTPIVILSADEAPPSFHDNIVASIVKSRTSEKKIVEAILSYLPQKED